MKIESQGSSKNSINIDFKTNIARMNLAFQIHLNRKRLNPAGYEHALNKPMLFSLYCLS